MDLIAKWKWLLPALLLLPAWCMSAVPPLPNEIHTAGLAVIDCIYRENYGQADAIAQKTSADFRDNPAGDFFKALAVYSWMETHFSQTREQEFFRSCEDAVEKSESILEKSPNDFWAKFFMAGVEGVKALYEYKREHWISAFKWGRKSMAVLEDLKRGNAGMTDLDYGIASYEYCRSDAVSRIWWLPRVDDKRDDAEIKLAEVSRTGVYTRVLAGEALAGMFLNRGKWAEAGEVCDRFLKQYPDARAFLFSKGRALAGQHRYAEAEALFRRVIEKSGSSEDIRTVAYAHFWIGKILLQQGKYTESIAEFGLMRKCKTKRDTLKELKRDFDEEVSLRKQAEKGLGNRSHQAMAEK